MNVPNHFSAKIYRRWWAVAAATLLGCEAASGVPVARTAVWAGSEMIVWGGTEDGAGFTDAGWRFYPPNNSWLPTPDDDAPLARAQHTAVWTGSEMIIWGGDGDNSLNDGARFNPTLNSWIATPAANAPGIRASHSAVWTGSEMIVWGGYFINRFNFYLNTGARFDPIANTWVAVTNTGAPAVRRNHTSVWTGSEMIVWGGYSGSFLNSGGRYNAAVNSWSTVTTSGAPSTRNLHTAVWTGTEMIVWGGYNGSYTNSGGRYNPTSNSWTPTTTNAAPAARYLHTAVWTGTEMLIWGGYNGSNLNTGARYNPVANTWTAITTSGAPAARQYHTAVWTGSEMIVWGGYASGDYLTDGGRYNPTTDTWTPVCSGFQDSFTCHATISGDNILTTANNTAATKESGEPNHGGNAGGKSVWWSWTAPTSGGVTLTTAGSAFDTLLGVYTGTTVSALTTVASDGQTNLPGAVTFQATAGVNYKIAVDGNDGAAGNILLNLNLGAQPANDNFANRLSIASGGAVAGQNLSATKEANEPNHADAVAGKSVWWTWTATSNSCVTITTEGSDFDTLLEVYTNASLASLVSVAASDDATGDVTSSVSFNAVAGRTYQIAVDGFNGASGNIILQVLPFAGPLNDGFASPVVLTGINFNLTLSNLWGSVESGEPDIWGGPGAQSLWWQWTPATSGGATIDLRGSDYFTTVAVYTGSSLVSLITIASGQDYLVFKALGGTTYRIVVNLGGEFSDPAAAKLKFKLTLAPSPTNDNFANRTSLGLNTGVNTTGSNIGATTEPSEPPHQDSFAPVPKVSGKTVWWTWATPLNFPARVTVRSTNFLSAVTIYTGTSLGALTRIGGRVGSSLTNEVNFSAIPSTGFIIAVDSLDGTEGNFEFSIGNVSTATNDQFANRITLIGTNVFTTGWNKSASHEAGEPNHAGVPGLASLWWTWTAPGPGRVFLTTKGSSFPPLLAAYQGTSVNNLTSLGIFFYVGQQCPRFSFGDFDVAAGQTYQIAVDGETGSPQPTGGIDLSLTFVSKPANDNFASRTPLTGSYLVLTGSVVAASQEVGETLSGYSNGLRTVWYSWTAPTNIAGASGGVTLRVTGVKFVGTTNDPIAEIFQGNSLAALAAVPVVTEQIGNVRQVTFQAQAGAVYQIAVAAAVYIGGGFDGTFATHTGNLPPAPLTMSGSFVLRLNYSTLALRVRDAVAIPFPMPGTAFYLQKISFGAQARIINYGTTPTGPIRIRQLTMTSSGVNLGEADSTLITTGVQPGGNVSIPLNGACPPHTGVLVVLEELFGTEWFLRDSSLFFGVGVIGNGSAGLCSIITGGGVVLLEPGIGAGQCFCPPLLTSVQINGPASVTEGSATAFWGTAVFNNGSTPNFTNTLWTTSNTNKFPITTNGLLTAGSVTTDTVISVNTRFSYLGIEQSTTKPVSILNLPPPSLANLLRLPNGNFQLSLQGVPNRQHVVEATTNLSSPIQWTSLTTNAANQSGTFQFTDTKATNFLQRYYRAREN